MPSPTSHTGNVSLAAAATELVKLGLDVFLPLGDGSKVDMVIAGPSGRTARVQVKTARLVRGEENAIEFNTRQVNANTKRNQYSDYRGVADLFIAWSPHTGSAYAVPVDDVPVGVCRLRLVSARNGQRVGTRSASRHHVAAFDFEGFLDRLGRERHAAPGIDAWDGVLPSTSPQGPAATTARHVDDEGRPTGEALPRRVGLSTRAAGQGAIRRSGWR